MIYIYAMIPNLLTIGQYPKDGLLEILNNDLPGLEGVKDLLYYDRKLTKKEVRDSKLVRIGGCSEREFLRKVEKGGQMSFRMLQADVLSWAKDKDLLHEENAEKQFMKFIEEVFEFKFEMENSKNYEDICEHLKIAGTFAKTRNKRDMMLEMGDIFVTLIILCEQLGIDPMECLSMAYEKISKRTGKTIGGQFIKSEDL